MKKTVQWKSEYRIGFEEVDKQHQKIFTMLARLEESLPKGLQNSTAAGVLKELTEYTQTHFRDEECLMAQINYQDLVLHTSLHQYLIREVKKILLTLKNDGDFGPHDLIEFLHNWIVDHILLEDMKIGDAYRKAIAASKEVTTS